MNTKLIITLTVLLMIIILIGLFFTRQNPETTLLPQKTETESAQITNEVQPPAAQMLPSQRAITIVEAPHKKHKTTPDIVNQESKTIEKANNYSPTESTAQKSAVQGEASSQSEAGITKINKLPTQEKLQEMKSKGIVLY